MKKNSVLILLIMFCIMSCNKNDLKNETLATSESMTEANKVESKVEENKIKVNFSLGKPVEYNNIVVEDEQELKKLGIEHSIKYYSYMPDIERKDNETFTYHDVGNNIHYMAINESLKKNTYRWNDDDGVLSKTSPVNCKMSYGIDISKHNGNIDFTKVKNAGFEFVFIRIAYRGYGKAGNLKQDEKYDVNLKNAKAAGLKIGAYVFSQATNEEEAREEANFAIELLKGYKLDLPLVFDPETIKGDIARTDNVSGEQFTKNAVAFCEIIKKAGFEPAVYSNMVWEDYYYDMQKLEDYEIWYADYSKLPQTPYDFKYWQFSEVGIVDGVKGMVDLNVMIEKRVD